MRRFFMCAAVITVAWAGSVGYAQSMKVTNVDDFKKAMQTIGGAFGSANKALQSGAMADAKTQVSNVKMAMMGVQGFTVDRKKDDLTMLAKAAIEKLGDLEKALEGTDAAAAGAAFKAAGGTCGACHMKYRDQDPTTKAYSFKPGVL